MAKSHTTNGEYTNPHVQFERADIAIGSVVRAATVLGVVLLAVGLLVLWLGGRLARLAERQQKAIALPAAHKDTIAVSPEPRLEGIDDISPAKLEKKNFSLFPPRAAEYYRTQEELLDKGDKDAKVEPIADAIEQLAKVKLKAKDDKPPEAFTREMRSKAASGRVSTGSQ